MTASSPPLNVCTFCVPAGVQLNNTGKREEHKTGKVAKAGELKNA